MRVYHKHAMNVVYCITVSFGFIPSSATFLYQYTKYSTLRSLHTRQTPLRSTQLSSAGPGNIPEPLASEGNWSAYIDHETTGFVYYFNRVTGESVWEKPTSTFPNVNSYMATTTKKKKKEFESTSQMFGGIFTNDGNRMKRSIPTGSTYNDGKQQLVDLQERVSKNNNFLNELDNVIAEAEEAIKFAEELDESGPSLKTKDIFSFFGLNKNDTPKGIKNTETLSTDINKKRSTIQRGVESVEKESLFSPISFKENSEGSGVTFTEAFMDEVKAEDKVWVEGLKNVFKKTFASFNPPKVASAIKVKAKVSDSDLLDVVWGAETSARPTLNIAVMMKAFQTQLTQEVSTEPEQQSSFVSEVFRTVSLDIAMQGKPHPNKISWGGEDAVFINGRNFGIFDGVSGAEKAQGKKLYSLSLADNMKRLSASNNGVVTMKASSSGWSIGDITDCLNEAKKIADMEGTGASTAVVASIGRDNVLRALNLGDSACLVIRDKVIVARTREIVHYFDCPYQLGGVSNDRPQDGTILETVIFPGDIIVAGSDGVFDNLSDADIVDLISTFPANVKSSVIAKKICEISRTVSLDNDALTPYSKASRGRSGYEAYKSGKGGKVDDISCVVVRAS